MDFMLVHKNDLATLLLYALRTYKMQKGRISNFIFFTFLKADHISMSPLRMPLELDHAFRDLKNTKFRRCHRLLLKF